MIDNSDNEEKLTQEELDVLNSQKGLRQLLDSKNINYKKALNFLKYEAELERLQMELVQLQRSVQEDKKRIAILFEGRDAAGKGGAIRRFIEHLSPRAMRVVALGKPTEVQMGQWYFQRYSEQLPDPGEIVFFDRSWYNRAVVEPVMGFCTKQQYRVFMRQVTEFEHMLYEDGVQLIKLWFSISKEEQAKRFESRTDDPLKQWKISPVDQKAQELWDKYTEYKNHMFSHTHTDYCPWIIVKADNKKMARLESIRYVLSEMEYPNKGMSGADLLPDPNRITRFFRDIKWLD